MENPWDRPLGFWHLAEEQPELPAVVEAPDGSTLTFGQLAGRAHQVVHALRDRGVVAGDIVAVLLLNSVDVVV